MRRADPQTGRSERFQIDPELVATRIDDIRAVMDAVGSERAALIGESEGGPLSMLFAAAYPERTHALVLAGAEVRERSDDEWPWASCPRQRSRPRWRRFPNVWGKGLGFQYLAPDVGDVDWGREWLGKVQRNAGTPGSTEAFMRTAYDIDVRHVAPAINVPTLVFHAARDQICHGENGRFPASTIRGARYVEVDAADHLPWFGLSDRLIGEVRAFLTGDQCTPTPDRVLATILFTDIVDSTRRATELGDERWRDVLIDHHSIIRSAVERHRGREVDMAGDGVFAIFDGPARVVVAVTDELEATP